MTETNLYWPVYKNLEKEVLELSYSIHFCDAQTGVYSVQISELLLRCSVEIESLSKALYEAEGGDMNPVDESGEKRFLNYDFDCLKMLDIKWMLSKKRILLAAPSMYFEKEENRIFTPLKNAHKGEASWQKSYQAVKHNRVAELARANIQSLVRAMAALYLLNVYYRDETFPIGARIDNSIKFDSSMQSDLFSVKYEILTTSNYKGDELTRHPEATYVGVMTEKSYAHIQKEYIRSNEELREIVASEVLKDPKRAIENLENCQHITDVLFRLDLFKSGSVKRAINIQANAFLSAQYEAILNKGQNILVHVENQEVS